MIVVTTGWVISKIGLVLNLAGTVMVACSFGRNLADAYQEDRRGQRVYLASFLHPRLFWWGLVVIALGFAAQLAG